MCSLQIGVQNSNVLQPEAEKQEKNVYTQHSRRDCLDLFESVGS